MSAHDFKTTFENEHRHGPRGLVLTGRTRVMFESGYVDGALLPDLLRTIAKHLNTTADEIGFARARDEERDLALRAGPPNLLPESPRHD